MDITTKNGKGKLPLFHGNSEWVIPIYVSCDRTYSRAEVRLMSSVLLLQGETVHVRCYWFCFLQPVKFH